MDKKTTELPSKKKKVGWYIAYAAIFLICIFIVGPLLESSVIDTMKPFILVDKMEYIHAKECGAASKDCDLPPVLPLEMKGVNFDGLNPDSVLEISATDSVTGELTMVKVMKLPVEKVPQEYLPYVHYPESWDKWWNLFQPNGIGPVLRIALSILVPLGAVALLVYCIILWRKGKFKNLWGKMKP